MVTEGQDQKANPVRRLLGVVIALALLSAGVLIFEGGNDDPSKTDRDRGVTTQDRNSQDEEKPDSEPADGAGDVEAEKAPEVPRPKPDAEVIRCGSDTEGEAPSVRITNSSDVAARYMVVVQVQSGDGDELGVVGARVPSVEPGQSTEVDLDITFGIPEDATCEVQQVVKTPG